MPFYSYFYYMASSLFIHVNTWNTFSMFFFLQISLRDSLPSVLFLPYVFQYSKGMIVVIPLLTAVYSGCKLPNWTLYLSHHPKNRVVVHIKHFLSSRFNFNAVSTILILSNFFNMLKNFSIFTSHSLRNVRIRVALKI